MQIRNFCLRSNLRKDDKIYCLKASAGLKTGVENDIFRSSEDMENRGHTPTENSSPGSRSSCF